MKKFIKIIIAILLIFCTLLCAGCSSSNEKEKIEQQTVVEKNITINDEQKHILQQYIEVIPPFEDIGKVDNTFWHDFICNLYIRSDGNNEIIIADKEEKKWAVVEHEAISAITQQLFGVNLPDYYPYEEDLYRNGTSFYVLLSSPKEEDSIFSSYEFVRVIKNEITFKNTKTSKYIYYELRECDNQFGFIIKSLNSTGESPAVITKPETTTRHRVEITEENSSEPEDLMMHSLRS